MQFALLSTFFYGDRVPATDATDVVVTLTVGAASAEEVGRAVARCEATHARLRLLCVIPRTSRWLALAGVDPAAMERTLTYQATEVLRRALLLVPAGVPTTTQLCFGSARR